MRRPDELALTLREADQARAYLAALTEELDSITAQLTRLPTQREMAQTALLATITGAALVTPVFSPLR